MEVGSRGFVAITTVLILSAIVLVVVSTISMLSIGEVQSSLALSRGSEGLNFAEGCIEGGLLKARSDNNFGNPTGVAVNITRPEGTCVITVVSKIGTVWTMEGSSNSSNYSRKIRVIFDRTASGIVLSSWKEI